MRALNKGWIGIALVILFGASLFFFRGSARYSNLFNSDNFVANVSGTQISTSQFLRSLEMNIGQFAQMIGQELTGDQIRAFQIHQLVLQNLVNNAIFENEFDKLNYIIDDSIIAEKTKKRFPNLYLNNKINDDALKSFLSQQRLKIEDLVNIISYETRSVVFDDLFFEKNYPKKISSKIDMYNAQTRKVEILKVPFDKIIIPNINENNITIENSELINYFEENINFYMSKEKRDISYIVIDKEDYKNTFTPSDNEILNYFENNKNIYTIPEKRSFIQFNFKSKEEAEDFKIKISGLSIDDIKKYATKNKIKFNDFKDVNKNQVLDELSNVIFKLNINEVSDIVKTTLAHHLLILDDIHIKREPILSEVSDTIKTTLTTVQLDNFFNDLKLKINQQILNGLSIGEIAKKNDLSIKNRKNIEQNNEENDIFINDIINESFSQNKDFVSNIIDFDNNKSFIINVDEIYPSKQEDINTVFDNLLSDFLKFKKIEFAKKIFDKSKYDKSLENINAEFGLNIEEKNIKLNSDILPIKVINKIFELELKGITFSSDEDNAYFVKLNNIDIPNETDISNDISLISELKNAFGNEIIKTKDITLNDELINGLLSQYK